MSKLQQLLTSARKQRENGKAEKSLQLLGEALLVAQRQKNHERQVQVLADRAVTYRHLFEDSADILYAILARKDAETMFELVKMFGVSERLHTSYYMLGQAALLFHDYADAENYFFKSLRYFKGSLQEKGSWRYHWAKSLYMIGEKQKALLAFAKAFEEIKKSSTKIDSFLLNVYLSGANIYYAYVLAREKKREEARHYYHMAKAICDKDKRLVVRKKQLKELEKQLTKLKVL